MNEFIEDGMYGCGFTRDMFEDVVNGEQLDCASAELCLDEAHDDVEFYREFNDYLLNAARHYKLDVFIHAMELVKDCSTCRFVGYTDILKTELKNNKVYFTVNIEDCQNVKNGKMNLREFTGDMVFEYYAEEYYGCVQKCDGEDSYYGLIFFPTEKTNHYFCFFYTM